jgi:ssDNA-binding Zn-finger/Zn-ribbon topoisomerase 1
MISSGNTQRDEYADLEEDVGLEESYITRPAAVDNLVCPECGAHMVLRESKKFRKPFYGCERFPECRAAHGAHTDGRPLGIPANADTKRARMRAHRVFDALWQAKPGEEPIMSRVEAYVWMGMALRVSPNETNIGRFSREQCEKLVQKVLKKYPEAANAWDRLLEDPFD